MVRWIRCAETKRSFVNINGCGKAGAAGCNILISVSGRDESVVNISGRILPEDYRLTLSLEKEGLRLFPRRL